jgi:hypothetical protein
MARGGKREGAGRKPGVPNTRTAERTAEIEASGLTPLNYMLSILRDETKDDKDRMWAAEKAAPYVHAKLASIEHKGGLDVTTQTKEQRDAAVAAATRADA